MDFEQLRFSFTHSGFRPSFVFGVLVALCAGFCITFTAGPLFSRADVLFARLGPEPVLLDCRAGACDHLLEPWLRALPDARIVDRELLAVSTAAYEQRAERYEAIRADAERARSEFAVAQDRQHEGWSLLAILIVGLVMGVLALVLFRRVWVYRPFLVCVDRHTVRSGSQRIPLGAFDENTLQEFLDRVQRYGHRVRPHGFEEAIAERSRAQRHAATPGPEEQAALQTLAAHKRSSTERR